MSENQEPNEPSPYTVEDLVSMDDIDFEQLMWLVGRFIGALSLARASGHDPTDPRQQGYTSPPLIFDSGYREQTGLEPAMACFEIRQLWLDLMARKYVRFDLSISPFDRQGEEVYIAEFGDDPEDINEQAFLQLSEDISKVVAARRKKEQSAKQLQSGGEKTRSPIQLPRGTTWENIEIRFKDMHTIAIFVNGEHRSDHDYIILGFAKRNATKDEKFDKQWKFLHLLAIVVEHRDIRPPTKALLIDSLETTSDGFDQIKSTLSKKLKSVFEILDDPFHPYDPETGYRPKFTLKPEPSFRNDGELHASGGKLFEENIGDAHKEKSEDTLEGRDD